MRWTSNPMIMHCQNVILKSHTSMKVLVYAPVICNHCSAPPPPPPPHLRGIAGTTTFHPNSPAKSPVLRGPAESHSPALYKSKFLGVYLRNITSPALTQYCGGTQKVIAPHISPAIPVVGGGVQALQITGALIISKISVSVWNFKNNYIIEHMNVLITFINTCMI